MVAPTSPTMTEPETVLADALAATKLDDMPDASPPAGAPPPAPAVTPTLGGVPGVPTAPQPGALGTRTALPDVVAKPSPFSLWKFIKDAAGERIERAGMGGTRHAKKRPAGPSQGGSATSHSPPPSSLSLSIQAPTCSRSPCPWASTCP